jgi:hypothetical protein
MHRRPTIGQSPFRSRIETSAPYISRYIDALTKDASTYRTSGALSQGNLTTKT